MTACMTACRCITRAAAYARPEPCWRSAAASSSANDFPRANSGMMSCITECTLFMYIGELCRYLSESPPHPLERAHRLRLACGNGLRDRHLGAIPEALCHSRDRGILCGDRRQCHAVQFRGQAGRGRPDPVVSEDGLSRPRSCASISRRRRRFRNAQGLCEEAAPGEVGEAVGRIFDDPSRADGPVRRLYRSRR